MNSRLLLGLALVCFLSGCSDVPRSPTAPIPDPTLNNLIIQSVSTFITVGDYRLYSVRIRVREASATPVTISRIVLQFRGDGIAVSRTFSNIAENAIGPSASVELDDLHVADESHEFDSARTILVTVTYAAAGQMGAAVVETPVPNCATFFEVWGASNLIAVKESMQMYGGIETGCSPTYYPVDASSIEWRTLNPTVASINRSGVITGLANGLATIQGTYGRTVSSHKVRVGPLVGPPAKVEVQGWRTARPGHEFRLYLQAEWPDGIKRDVTDAARWESSNPSIATMSSGGNTTAGSEGIVSIKGTYDGVSATAPLGDDDSGSCPCRHTGTRHQSR